MIRRFCDKWNYEGDDVSGMIWKESEEHDLCPKCVEEYRAVYDSLMKQFDKDIGRWLKGG